MRALKLWFKQSDNCIVIKEKNQEFQLIMLTDTEQGRVLASSKWKNVSFGIGNQTQDPVLVRQALVPAEP